MSMSDWARREVEIACKREAPDRKDGEWDYGCGCYASALKAYLSLMDDGHSGLSFSFTAAILKRLLEGKPLTPIEDVPEVWDESHGWADDGKHYQCNRMTSLFKDIDEKGNVTYHDMFRYKSPTVIVYVQFEDGGKLVKPAYTVDGVWKFPYAMKQYKITHWMPLPEPPKEG